MEDELNKKISEKLILEEQLRIIKRLHEASEKGEIKFVNLAQLDKILKIINNQNA